MQRHYSASDCRVHIPTDFVSWFIIYRGFRMHSKSTQVVRTICRSFNDPLYLYCTGQLRKIRNHVTEFGSTGAMATTGSCLVSAGYDLDRGNGYLNGKMTFKTQSDRVI